MRRLKGRRTSLLGCGLVMGVLSALLGTAGVVRAEEPAVPGFSQHIAPLLQTYCVGCHGADDPEGGLRLESYEQLMAGGHSGVVVTPGEPASSPLLQQLRGTLAPAMPPKSEDQPTEDEIARMEAWIVGGAPGPDGPVAMKRRLRVPHVAADPDVALPVTSIGISGNGQLRAVGRHGRVELWDADNQHVSTFRQELGKVNGAQFNANATRLLVASGVPGAYGNAVVFDVETGKVLMELVGHRDVLYSAVWSPDESLIATAGYDRQIIVWDAEIGNILRHLKGHHGAVFDLAFAPDGKVLCSACADETVKVWNVATGERLDTLGQPTAEVMAVEMSPDGKQIVAASADNRLRVWNWQSKDKPAINPLVVTRFVDESPLLDFAFSPDGQHVVAMAQSGALRVLRTSDWTPVATLKALEDVGSQMQFLDDGRLLVALMNGSLVERSLPQKRSTSIQPGDEREPVFLDLGELTRRNEDNLEPNASGIALLDRGCVVRGTIGAEGEVDAYAWNARAGEVWAIDADAVDKSRIDPIVALFDESGNPLLRVRLQAIRDTWFTFRGKDSRQVGDFRLFDWQELNLDAYLYSAGEVTRLWMHPRGPDSGFTVYPGMGLRWTWFGTTHTTHALGDPAYIVRPLATGEIPIANGLPVFDVYYENDDDPHRDAGTNSRLLIQVPEDGRYTVKIRDTRGDGGSKGYEYALKIRPANPHFTASVAKPKTEIRRGTGREFQVTIKRFDGFEGPVRFEIPNLPRSVVANVPLVIEAGQNHATGTIWASEDADWEEDQVLDLVARARINGRTVERSVGNLGALKLIDRPRVIPSVQPLDREVAEDAMWTLAVKRGETTSARVRVRRQEGFTGEVRFGNETSGRNASQGVYVDNIGLNGLLITPNSDEREFFLTADPTATLGRRTFFLTAQLDDNVTTHPIIVEVLP